MQNEGFSIIEHFSTTNTKKLMTAELSDEDLKEALSLLKAKRKEEAKEIKIKDEMQKIYEMFFTILEVSHDKKIKISEFSNRISRICSDNLVLWKEDGKFHARSYREDESGRLDGYGQTGLINRYKYEYRKTKGKRDSLNEDNTRDSHSYYGECEVFYMNRIEECPFSGKQRAGIGRKAHLHLILNLSYPPHLEEMTFSKDDFYKTHKIYRRQPHLRNISRKKYLENFKDFNCMEREWAGNKDALDLFHKIYPETQKNTKKYFAEKRVKKVIKTRSLTPSETNFFTLLLGASKLKNLTK